MARMSAVAALFNILLEGLASNHKARKRKRKKIYIYRNRNVKRQTIPSVDKDTKQLELTHRSVEEVCDWYNHSEWSLTISRKLKAHHVAYLFHFYTCSTACWSALLPGRGYCPTPGKRDKCSSPILGQVMPQYPNHPALSYISPQHLPCWRRRYSWCLTTAQDAPPV